MRLESRKYLYDIREAAGLANQFTAGSSFEEYQRNPMRRLAVERAFAIVGEALVQLARIARFAAGSRRAVSYGRAISHSLK